MKPISVICLAAFTGVVLMDPPPATGDQPKGPITGKATLDVLFIGNSYTARHDLAQVVEQLAESANPNLDFRPTQVIYGGRTLKDHWRLGTQHVVNRASMTDDKDVLATIATLESAIAGKEDKYANSGLKNMQSLLSEFRAGTLSKTHWDWVVLQSYRDDLDGADSLYMQYAPRFVSLAKSQGAKVLLYETTPKTQNENPITETPPVDAVMKKARSIAKLAKSTGASVAPMSFVAHRCQTKHPEFTLRFHNDAHLNQTMAYLTACTIYAAMFDSSPLGVEVDSVTDIRFWQNNRQSQKDRDEKPIKRVFTAEEREALQSTAWNALAEFKSSF